MFRNAVWKYIVKRFVWRGSFASLHVSLATKTPTQSASNRQKSFGGNQQLHCLINRELMVGV